MGYIAGIAREQLILFPESLDEYIAPDNPVRFIDAWVDTLELAALGSADTVPAETGRPRYDPRLSLKLYQSEETIKKPNFPLSENWASLFSTDIFFKNRPDS